MFDRFVGNVVFICLRSALQIVACYRASMFFNEKIVKVLLGCELGQFQKIKRETILQRFTIDMMRVRYYNFYEVAKRKMGFYCFLGRCFWIQSVFQLVGFLSGSFSHANNIVSGKKTET